MRCVVGGGWAWFREGGGMPSISLAPLSGRYLPFTVGEIAVLRARVYCV